MRSRLMRACSLALTLAIAATLSAESLEQKVDPWVLETASRGTTEFLVMLRSQADLRGARTLAPRTPRRAFVVDALRAEADDNAGSPARPAPSEGRRPSPVLGREHDLGPRRPRARRGARGARATSSTSTPTRASALDGPVDAGPARARRRPTAIEWNIARVNAPEVWALGFNGPGRRRRRRRTPATSGTTRRSRPSTGAGTARTADHNYNWHDAIHSGGGVCGANSPAPCDDHGHGTHTMGTMVGDDGGANQIGMAPGAKWIGCRNMDQGNGTPGDLHRVLPVVPRADRPRRARTRIPPRRPHVINNSWGCPPSEGCTDPTVLPDRRREHARRRHRRRRLGRQRRLRLLDRQRPPGDLRRRPSGRRHRHHRHHRQLLEPRPGDVDGSNRIKPDISRPGVNIRSSVPGGGYAHVERHQHGRPARRRPRGAAALRQPRAGRRSRRDRADHHGVGRATHVAQTCGGVPGSAIPNNTYGWGRVDALAAVQGNADLAGLPVGRPGPDDPDLPRHVHHYGHQSRTTPGEWRHGLRRDDPTGHRRLRRVEPGLVHPARARRRLQSRHDVERRDRNRHGRRRAPGRGHAHEQRARHRDELRPEREQQFGSDTDHRRAVPAGRSDAHGPGIRPRFDRRALRLRLLGHRPPGLDHWTLSGGTITAGQGSNGITFDAGGPGTTMALEVVGGPIGPCAALRVRGRISVDFLDVPPTHLFHDFVNSVARRRRDGRLRQRQLLPRRLGHARADGRLPAEGASSARTTSRRPRPATVFGDVAAADPFAPWIEELSALGVTGGCGAGNYCPDALGHPRPDGGVSPEDARGAGLHAAGGDGAGVRRRADRVHLLPIGSRISPRAASRAAAASGNYCPASPNTRGQMAVFLVRTFAL